MKETVIRKYNELIERKNEKRDFYNGIYERWKYPVLTREHIPPEWRYDFSEADNPFFMERLGVNAVFNTGAILYNGKFVLMPRVEGADRKSFFAVCESESGVDSFRFWEYPVLFDKIGNETNLYDMRLTRHEDGYIYGLFCAESEGAGQGSEPEAACGIVRTKDLLSFERLPNLKTNSPQQRNCVLHPEFVNGKYLIYTRPQDGFIEVGGQGGICGGLTDSMENAVIAQERLIAPKRYHTIYESKNGEGIVPVKTDRGWIHIAHGVRNTAAGLRYVIYAFATALDDPFKVIATPSGYLLAPRGKERIGDVSNVVFTNGAIVKGDTLYLYYGASDTRVNVATMSLGRLVDYVFSTPSECFNTFDSVRQRIELIRKNKNIIKDREK